jgi:lipid-A-disaccharide synthase
LVAGEVSGDRLGAALMRAIRDSHPQAIFEGVAGPQMREAGCRAVGRSERMAVMGLAEVLVHLPRLLRLRRELARYFQANRPDVFVGIDVPDFNLGLERSLKRVGIPTVHWVSPSVWAWRTYRVKKIRDSVDLMLTLFPFEAQFYAEHDVDARFVGHPMADEIIADQSHDAARDALGLDPRTPCIALLPGSREHELKRLLPAFLGAALLCKDALHDMQFVLPVANPGLMPLCRQALAAPRCGALQLRLLDGDARTAMQAANVVLLASGSATLECMLLQRPMVVAYRMHPLSYGVVTRMLHVPWVSLPNNLLGTGQVPEFLQHNATPEHLAQAVLDLLRHPDTAQQQVRPFAEVHRQLKQNAAQQAARHILERVGYS